MQIPILYRESDVAKGIKMHYLKMMQGSSWTLNWQLLQDGEPLDLTDYDSTELVYGVNNVSSSVVTETISGSIIDAENGEVEFDFTPANSANAASYNFHISIQSSTSGEDIIFPYGQLKLVEQAAD